MAAVTLQIVSMSHTDYCILGLFVCLYLLYGVCILHGFFLHCMLHCMIVCELDQAADGIHFDRLDQNKTNICILQVTRNCPPPSPPIVFKAQRKEMHAGEK